MGAREDPLLAFAAVALAVALATLDTVAERATFDAGGFALELLEWAGIVGALVAAIAVLRALRRLRTDQAAMRDALARALPPEAGDDPAAAIRHQFEAWALTPAEADIAGLLLKGVSLRDVARLRRTTEATIRQQAQGVYRKSGLGGRAELAAFFLDSLSDSRLAPAAAGRTDRQPCRPGPGSGRGNP
jgi:DNA-binding CsgD family transcriptional regulator